MNVIEVSNHEIDGQMSYKEIGLTVDKATVDFGVVLTMCLDCSIDCPVKEIRWELVSGRYEFHMKTRDNKDWIQTVRLDGKEIWLTCRFDDEFSGSFVLHLLKMRKEMVKISAKYKVAKIELSFV